MSPISWRGVLTDERTTQMVAAAEQILRGKLTVSQGSYHRGVSASAGTHDGGGVVDFSVRGLTLQQINARVRALRMVGFAAWHRTPDEGPWPEHIHAVAVGCHDLAPVAARQVDSLRAGRNGLRSNRLDRHRGMHLPVITFEQYQQAKAQTPSNTVDLSDVQRTFQIHRSYVGLVARALQAEGLTPDRAGYRQWQQRLGFKGVDADGQAGMTSLRKLGAKHGWTVVA